MRVKFNEKNIRGEQTWGKTIRKKNDMAGQGSILNVK